MKKAIILLLFSILSLNLPAQLSDTEQKMADYIDATNDEAMQLLIESININSGTMNFEGVKEVGMHLMPHFEALGFDVEFQEGSEWNRAGHLVATWRGENAGPKLVLIGHLDTVFEPDSPFQKYEQLSDSVAKGPGIADMKGGNIIMLQALSALEEVGELDKFDITVVITGDEELSGRPLSLSKKALIDAAKYADIAIGFENGDGNYRTANVSRRGGSGWYLKVTGTPAHSSQIFREDIGSGAIFEAARILNAFHEDEVLRSEEYLTFNPGRILGGTTVTDDQSENKGTAFGKSNVIAETVIIDGGIRPISKESLARAQARMKEIVADNLPHTSATIEFGEGYPPLSPTEGNRKLLSVYSKASQDLGFGEVEAVNPLRAGAADVSFTAEYVEMAIDGLGMSGTAGHTVDEKGYLWSLPLQAKRAALLMYRLAND